MAENLAIKEGGGGTKGMKNTFMETYNTAGTIDVGFIPEGFMIVSFGYPGQAYGKCVLLDEAANIIDELGQENGGAIQRPGLGKTASECGIQINGTNISYTAIPGGTSVNYTNIPHILIAWS